jgi:hypothetical protein
MDDGQIVGRLFTSSVACLFLSSASAIGDEAAGPGRDP